MPSPSDENSDVIQGGTHLTLSSVRAVIATLAQAQAEHFDLQQLMSRAVGQARLLTQGDGAGIALRDGSRVVYRATTGTATAYQDLSSGLDDSLAGWVCKTGKRVACADPNEDSRVQHPVSRAAGFRSIMVVPIRNEEQVIGVLSVVSARATAFSEADGELAELLALAVGSAIARASADEARARLRDQLAAADRRASVGNLAAGVAHEINNPLSFILANLEYVRSEVSDLRHSGSEVSDDLLTALAEAKDGADRVRKIVRTLLTYSRDETEHREPLDPRGPIETAVRMAKGMVERVAKLEVALEAMPLVVGDDLQLGQVFLNLLVNAAQAIPSGQPAKHFVRVSSRVCDEQVVIEVQDSGPGMTPETAKRIFEPFFTTKPAGVGTGLGLALCQNILTSLGGTITVTSEPEHGACFQVTLPVAREPAAANPAPVAVNEERLGAGCRVLVVDDEPSILTATRRLLGECEVVTETEAAAALARLERGDRFGAILCDVQMPSLDGCTFSEEILRRFPDQAEGLILMSGSVLPEVSSPARPTTPFMLKPVDGSTLRRLVSEAAEQSREAEA